MRLDAGFLYCTTLISISGRGALERYWGNAELHCNLTAFPEAQGEVSFFRCMMELPEVGTAEQLCLLVKIKY